MKKILLALCVISFSGLYSQAPQKGAPICQSVQISWADHGATTTAKFVANTQQGNINDPPHIWGDIVIQKITASGMDTFFDYVDVHTMDTVIYGWNEIILDNKFKLGDVYEFELHLYTDSGACYLKQYETAKDGFFLGLGVADIQNAAFYQHNRRLMLGEDAKQISIFNLSGQELYSSTEKTIDLEQAPGIYIAQVQIPRGVISRKILLE